MDRDNVIKALECCKRKDGNECRVCPYTESEYCTEDMVTDALDLLKDQPQIVRCKDCKHLIDHHGFMDDGYCRKMREDYCIKFKPNADWFCAVGERK